MAVWIIVAAALIVALMVVAVVGLVLAGTGERSWSSRFPRIRRYFRRRPDDVPTVDE